MIHSKWWVLGNHGNKMADDLCSLLARKLSLRFFLQHRSIPYSCLLNRSLNGTNLISPDEKSRSIPFSACPVMYLRLQTYSLLKVPYPFGLNLDCLALFLFLRLHLLDIISPTGSNELIRYYVYIWINLGLVQNISYFEFNLSYSVCNMHTLELNISLILSWIYLILSSLYLILSSIYLILSSISYPYFSISYLEFNILSWVQYI